MCSYPRGQDNFDRVAHFGFYPVRLTLDVENHSVVAQQAGIGVAGFDVRWTGPIRLLHLENPGVERTANVSVLFSELSQKFFPD